MSPYWDLIRHHIDELDKVLKDNKVICQQVLRDHYDGHYYELLFDDQVETVARFATVSRLGGWNEMTDVTEGTEAIEEFCKYDLNLHI